MENVIGRNKKRRVVVPSQEQPPVSFFAFLLLLLTVSSTAAFLTAVPMTVSTAAAKFGRPPWTPQPQHQQQQHQQQQERPPKELRRCVMVISMMMVRNIDLPEALLLYGSQIVVENNDENDTRPGLVDLLQECASDGIPVIALLEEEGEGEEVSTAASNALTELTADKKNIRIMIQPQSPDNPVYDMLQTLEQLTIQPQAFGGSSGFGSKPADPERAPLPSRTVVLSTSVTITRVARACGMRVVSICCIGGDNDDGDDPWADAVVDDIDFGVDDIATPGSFWLNPPHPRDDDGNRVDDPYEWWQQERKQQQQQQTMMDSDENDNDSMDEDELNSILADLAPLE